jgi:hypothetical protein
MTMRAFLAIVTTAAFLLAGFEQSAAAADGPRETINVAEHAAGFGFDASALSSGDGSVVTRLARDAAARSGPRLEALSLASNHVKLAGIGTTPGRRPLEMDGAVVGVVVVVCVIVGVVVMRGVGAGMGEGR